MTNENSESFVDKETKTLIVESSKFDKLAKETRAIIAIIVTIFTFVLFYAVLFKDINPQVKDYIMFILGSVTTILSQIISYFFGASKSSDDKDNKNKVSDNNGMTNN